MTIEENIDSSEDAVCIANNYGRILSANKRFCRLFGFDKEEVEWHYLCDLYRHLSEWNKCQKSIPAPREKQTMQARMRNRAGRSFPCILTRRVTKSAEGIPLLINSIQKVAA
ncbi:hypothetical protein AGMMS49938_09360 [Fibrobacterales bacterium]|nr:hypothetical protein AGMMS49938_09360 [Fibrobacterales bacterium]